MCSGWPVNAKRVYRLYSEEGLTIRTKLPRRKRAWRYLVGGSGATAPNEIRAMDFVADQRFDGRLIRILAVIDAHTREALSIAARGSFRAFDVVQEVDRLARERGRPKTLKVDNGPEFAGRMLDQWAHLNGVEIDVSRPGKPTDNPHIEAFNSRLRAEWLNASWFLSLADARQRLEARRREYNEKRPHGSLRNVTPRAFAEQPQQAREVAEAPDRSRVQDQDSRRTTRPVDRFRGGSSQGPPVPEALPATRSPSPSGARAAALVQQSAHRTARWGSGSSQDLEAVALLLRREVGGADQRRHQGQAKRLGFPFQHREAIGDGLRARGQERRARGVRTRIEEVGGAPRGNAH